MLISTVFRLHETLFGIYFVPLMKDFKEEQELRQKLVGRFLKEAREESELTQHDVAKKLAYSSPQFVSNWERGVSLPPLDMLPRLATMFSVQPKKVIRVMNEYQDELLTLQKRNLSFIFKKRKSGRA